jgi:DHA1 family bicyclomycin/chloramphenicol resistance-like MFS transporter
MQKSASAREFTLLMALLMSVVAISIDAFLPALGVLGRELGVTNPNRVQLAIGFIFAGLAIGELIAGPLSDAVGRKPILYAGIGLYLVGSVICYFAQDFTILLVGRFIQGLGVAGPYVTAVSVVRDKHSGSEMARVMSVVMMIFILVPAVAPSIGQVILHAFGWRAIFILYIIYSIVIGLWIMLRLEETLPPAQRVPLKWNAFSHGFLKVLGNRTTVTYMICMGFCFGILIGYLGASQQIFQDHFGVGDAFSLYFGGLALVIGAASLVNSRIVEKYGMRNICLHAMAIVVIASIAFLALHLVVAEVTLPMFIAYAVIVFFTFGLMFGNINAIAMEPMGDIAGMAAAITGAVSSVLSLGFGTIIGQLYNNTLIPIASGFLILAGAAWILMKMELRWYNAAPHRN